MSTIYSILPPNIPSAGVYYFTTNAGIQYEVRFGRKKNDLLNVTIVFGVINEEYEGEEYILTNKGDVFRVMNTISKIIELYNAQHPNIRIYEFTGEPTEGEPLDKPTKRLRMYVRYVKRLFHEVYWDMIIEKNKITVTRKLV